VRTHLWLDLPLGAGAIAGGLTLGWPIAAGCTALVVALNAWGVVSPRSSLYLPVHWRLPGKSPVIALTYDDGPDPDSTPALLELLAQHGAQATFFVIGSQVRRHPEIVRRIRVAGHALGIHSDQHSHSFNLWSRSRVEADLSACADSIAQATGEPPPRLFRPPIGLKNPIIGGVIKRSGLTCVTWSVGGGDSHRRSVAILTRRYLRRLIRGSIVLLHDGQDPAAPQPRPHLLPLTRALLERAAQCGFGARGLCPTADGVGTIADA